MNFEETQSDKQLNPIVSVLEPDIMLFDYGACTAINAMTVRHIREQMADNWPDINATKVLQDMRNIHTYAIDPDLFSGRGRAWSVTAAAWIIDPSMKYGIERAIHSLEINVNIQMFVDYDEGLEWLRAY